MNQFSPNTTIVELDIPGYGSVPVVCCGVYPNKIELKHKGYRALAWVYHAPPTGGDK